ncbi:putative G-protein coupled receptor 34 [Arapaima gigas]
MRRSGGAGEEQVREQEDRAACTSHKSQSELGLCGMRTSPWTPCRRTERAHRVDTMSGMTTSPYPFSSTEVSTHNNETCHLDDSAMRIPLALIYAFFFVFGLAGNLLALWVFIFLHAKKNSVRVFLINIAIADLILLLCLPFRVFYHSNNNQWPLGQTWCKVVGNIFYMNMYISIILLGCISVDRYIKIQQGTPQRLQGSSWSIAACAVIWTLSTVAVIPMIIFSEGNEKANKCFQYKQRKYAKGKAYFNLFLVGFFWLVFIFLIISYGKIAMKLLRTSKKKPDLPNALKYNRTAKKSFFILFLFTVCFVPYHIFRIFYIHSQVTETSCDWKGIMDKVNEVVLLFSAFNSCLDPVMYFLLSGSVRKETVRFINTTFFKIQDSGGNSSTTEYRRTSLGQVSSTPRNSISLIITQRCKSTPQHDAPH